MKRVKYCKNGSYAKYCKNNNALCSCNLLLEAGKMLPKYCNVAGVKANKNTKLSDKDPHGTRFICNSETLDKTQTTIEKQNKEALSDYKKVPAVV